MAKPRLETQKDYKETVLMILKMTVKEGVSEEEVIADFLNDFKPIFLVPEMEKAFIAHFIANFRSGYNLAESHLNRTISHYQVLGEFVRAERNIKYAKSQILGKRSVGWTETETFGSLYGALCAVTNVGLTSQRYLPNQQNQKEIIELSQKIRAHLDQIEAEVGKGGKIDFKIRLSYLKKKLSLAAEKKPVNKMPIIEEMAKILCKD